MKRLMLVALLLSTATVAHADQTTRYDVIFQGHLGGSQTVITHKDGSTEAKLSYRDNGRGPDLDERIKYGSDGTLIDYQLKGTSTFGAPVDEGYTRRGDKVTWHSAADHGTKSVSGPTIYLPVEFTFEPVVALIRQANKQPDHRLGGIPAGDIKVERVTELQVSNGGSSRKVALYAITGIATQPGFVWLNDDADQKMFAFVAPGYVRVIEPEWSSQGDALEKKQLEVESDLLHKLHQQLAHEFKGPIVIRNVRVFDSKNAKLLPPSDVYIAWGKIASIYPAGSSAREAGTEIDGSGQVLLPALFDMHTHESTWNLLLQIAGGVTTSRDMGNDNATLAQIRSDVDTGQIVGPRIIPCGFIEGKSDYSSQGGFVVDSLQQAKEAVDWYAQHGFRQIKIYNSFHPDWVQETAAYAHERGMRVSGHIPAFMKAEDAVRAGYDEIQHINQVMLNFYVGPKTDTRTLARFYLIADNTHKLDLDSKPVTDLIDLLKSHNTDIDTTLTAFEGMFIQKQGEINPSFAYPFDHVPVTIQRGWRTNSMNVTDKNADKYRASFAKMLEFVNRMHKAGIPFVAGTDDIAGFTLHRELELYVKAGLTPAEALQVATWNGAEYTRTLDQLGSIEPGKYADLLLVDGDPTADISAIRKARMVMKQGTVFYPAEVYEAVGVKRFAEPAVVKPSK
jgi:hypothetical protein